MAHKIGEVSLYYIKEAVAENIKVRSSKYTYDFLHKVYKEKTVEYRESFYVILLDTGNNIIDYSCLHEGAITGCLVDVRMIMQTALLKNATRILVSHNHPSGNSSPSEADKKLTKKIKEACKVMDIPLLDHVIYTKKEYYSFSD